MSGSNGHRWSKWWWADDRNDPALRMCCLAARGLWKELLGLMFEAAGYLLVGGKQPTPRQLAVLVGATEKEVKQLLAELDLAGVFSRTDDGTIYSRRMVRDIAFSASGREHAAKRDYGPRPNGLPSGLPNGLPTREANGSPNGIPISPPTPPSPEAEAEEDSEERKQESKKTLPFTPNPREGSGGARRPSDGLEAILAAAGVERPPRFDRRDDPKKLSDDPALDAQIRRLGKACALRVPYGEVRSVEAQLEAMAQPGAVGADETMGLRWQPAWQPEDPVESAIQQLVGLGLSREEAEARMSHVERAGP